MNFRLHLKELRHVDLYFISNQRNPCQPSTFRFLPLRQPVSHSEIVIQLSWVTISLFTRHHFMSACAKREGYDAHVANRKYIKEYVFLI